MNLHISKNVRRAAVVLACSFATSLLACYGAACQAAEEKAAPNVILIMADDLGYGDLGCYGNKTLKTPALDRMAQEGVRLTSFYAGCTICTPSRMALLTGAYPARLGWQGGVVGYGIRPSNGLAPAAVTIAEAFRQNGYATAISGKWHLGDSADLLPMNQGFESCYYIRKSNNQTKKLFRDGKLIEDPFINARLSEKFSAEAVRFITEKRNKPFFLYLPFTAPHFPAQAHPDWKGRTKLGAYGDVVEELDRRIAEIFTALKSSGQDQNTIVVFTSDNGPDPSQKRWATAKPYRGLKWSALEGGNRVPCIIRWPGVAPAGKVMPQIVASVDLMPTLLSASGIRWALPADAGYAVDGLNVWQSVVQQRDVKQHARDELLYWHGWGMLQAIRVGDWKLYVDEVKELPASKSGPVLFDLSKDQTEEQDISAQHPERVKQMLQLARKRLADIKEASLPLGGPQAQPWDKLAEPKWLK